MSGPAIRRTIAGSSIAVAAAGKLDCDLVEDFAAVAAK
jgi:hypothetical protein